MKLDLIIAARNEIEHDAIMHRVLQRARRDNIVFNAGKIKFKVTTWATSLPRMACEDRSDRQRAEANRQTQYVAASRHDQVPVAVHPQ